MSIPLAIRQPWDCLLSVPGEGGFWDASRFNRTPTVGSGATIVSRCIDFDGTSNASLTFPDDALFEAAPFTVSLWVRIDSGTTTRINLIGKNDNSGLQPGWCLQWTPTTNGIMFLTVYQYTSHFRVSYVTGTTGFNDGVWRHIAITCSDINSNVLMYINGAAQTVSTSNGGTVSNITNSAPLRLAGLNFSIATSTYLNGAESDAFIFDRVLSAAEIYELYILGSGKSRP